MSTPNTPASNDFVLVPRVATEAMLDVMHASIRTLVDPEARTADIQNDRELWSALLAAAAAPTSPEPVQSSWIERKVRKDTDEYRTYLRARFPGPFQAPSPFDFDGHKWSYYATSFDDLGEFDIIHRPRPASSEAPTSATASDWVNSIPGVRSTDQFIALDRRVFEDCIDRALAASNEAPGRGGEIEALRLHVTHLIYAIDGGYFGDNAGLRESAFVEPIRAFVTPGFEPVAAAPSSGELA